MNTSPFGACHSSDHLSRRFFLRSSALTGLGWLTPLSQQLARGAEKSGSRPKSVIVLWMQGGASQLETFDPHPDSAISHGAKAIKTSLPGIHFGEGLEQTAELANEFSILRSIVSKEGDHARATYHGKTGYRPFPGLVHPAIGSIITHELPAPTLNGTPVDIPTHISITPGQFPARGGYLGAKYDAFQLHDPVNPVPDVKASTDQKRTARRIDSLNVLEKSFAAGRLPELEKERTLHRSSIQRAQSMMSSHQLAAFNIKEAPKAEREAFGETRFGRGCLAAIRLVGAGVRCVEVTLNGWDTHINNHEGQLNQKQQLDPALASLIKGLKERDLYEDTVVLVATEFGRTPKLNVTDGRDHWPHGFSVLMGGGGLRSGQVIGETDRTGKSQDPADKVLVQDLHATILNRLGIDYEYEFMTSIGRPIALSDGRPIAALL